MFAARARSPAGERRLDASVVRLSCMPELFHAAHSPQILQARLDADRAIGWPGTGKWPFPELSRNSREGGHAHAAGVPGGERTPSEVAFARNAQPKGQRCSAGSDDAEYFQYGPGWSLR